MHVLRDQILFKHEVIHFRLQETSEGIRRRLYNWIAAEIKRGVEDKGNSGNPMECRDEVIVAAVCLFCDRLNPTRPVHVDDGGDVLPFLSPYGCRKQHKRTLFFQFKVV